MNFLNPRRLIRSRLIQGVGVVLVLALAWVAWWYSPLRPEIKLHIPADKLDRWEIAANGRWVVCAADPEPPDTLVDDGVPAIRRVEFYELPSGKRQCVLNDPKEITGLRVAPDGKRFFYCDGDRRYHLCALPSGSSIGS